MACLGPAVCGAAPATVISQPRPRLRFDIGESPLSAALLSLAKQAQISIEMGDLKLCRAFTPGLHGQYSAGEALGILLRGAGCRAVSIDDTAFKIVRLPEPRPVQMVRPVEAPPDLATVVVFANRRLTSALLIDPATLVLDGETLQAQGVSDISQFARLAPGMTVTNLGPGRDKIILRGLSDGPLTGQAESMVGLYLDDVRLTYNAPDPDLRLVDIAAVDVARGPQGALYGAGALGGVVQIMSNRPDPSRMTARLIASSGWTNGGAPSHAVDAVFNLPLFDHRGAVRLVAYEDLQGGYLDNPTRHIEDTNRTLRRGLRLSAELELNPHWNLDAGFIMQGINNRDTQYQTASSRPDSRDTIIGEPHDNDFDALHVTLSGRLGPGRINWTTTYLQHSLFSRFDASAAPPLGQPGSPAAVDDEDGTHSFSTDLTFSSASSSPVRWLGGLFAANTHELRTISQISLSDSNSMSFRIDGSVLRKELAAYGEFIVPLTPWLELNVGGRLFSDVAETRSDSTATGPFEPVHLAYRTDAMGFAPKLVLKAQAADWLSLYASASEGYRAPGANLATLPGPVAVEQPTFGADELWNLETGASLVVLEGKVRAKLALYQALWRNIQSDQLRPNGLPYTVNIGDGRNVGLEGLVSAQQGALEFQMDLLLDDPELTHPATGYIQRSDSNLSASPNFTAGMFGKYTWQLPGDAHFDLNVRATYVGASHLILAPLAYPRMGDYMAGRVSGSWRQGPWRASLSVENPANATGNTFAFGNPFSARLIQQTTPLRPRTVTVELNRAF